MKRLWRYLEGRKRFAALMVLVGAGNAAAQTGGWLLVRNAIDKGIVRRQRAPPDDRRDRSISASPPWAGGSRRCSSAGSPGSARPIVIGLRRDLFDHLTSLSLRYFSQQKAGWIIARLTSDVDAVSDTLSQGMPTLLANVILLPAAVAALLIADWRLGLVAFGGPAAGAHPVALVPARLARRARRAAQPHRRGDRADRRVGGRHGGRAGVQPRAPLPGASSTS